nr:SidA/IucD/PvdA family monooxygenase [Kribbella italica]
MERQRGFGWHRGMLIEDATMQVSFLKDLVTLRNPASEFTFLTYLHSKGRLVDFINHKTLFPPERRPRHRAQPVPAGRHQRVRPRLAQP